MALSDFSRMSEAQIKEISDKIGEASLSTKELGSAMKSFSDQLRSAPVLIDYKSLATIKSIEEKKPKPGFFKRFFSKTPTPKQVEDTVKTKWDFDIKVTNQAKSSEIAAIIKSRSEEITSDEILKMYTDTYPISIEDAPLTKGQKLFRLVLMQTADGRAVLAWSMGKIGGQNSVQVRTFDKTDEGEGMNAYSAKIAELNSLGYSVQDGKHVEMKSAHSVADIRNAIGRPLMSKIGGDTIKFMDPGANMDGVKDYEPPKYDQNGRINKETELLAIKEEAARIKRAKEELEQKELAEAKSAYEENPNYGAF